MNTPAKQNLRTTVDNVMIRADTRPHHTREAFSLGSADIAYINRVCPVVLGVATERWMMRSVSLRESDRKTLSVRSRAAVEGRNMSIDRDRIFSPFFTTKPNGMGMGLPITRSLIEGHGGHLWAEPDFPNGAVFSFTLPVLAGVAHG